MQHSWSLRCPTRLRAKAGKVLDFSTACHVSASQCTRPCTATCGFLDPAALSDRCTEEAA